MYCREENMYKYKFKADFQLNLSVHKCNKAFKKQFPRYKHSNMKISQRTI